MKILYVLGLCSVFLTGCHQMVNNADIARAIVACGSIDMIEEVQVIFTGSEWVKCKNKSREEDLEKVIIKDKP